MTEQELYHLAQQSHTQMMSYIIRTSEGHLIVIDGGTAENAPFLLEKLTELSGGGRPVIKAWFLTHAHSDHIDAFLELYRNYRGKFTAENLYCHFPESSFIEKNEDISYHTILEYQELRQHFAGIETILTEGMHLEIGSAAFDVLYTTDPAFTNNALNNSSTVLMLTLGGVKTLFLGDLGIEGGKKLLAYQKAGKISLKADLVELAHHGQSGVTYDVYASVRPSAALWCTPQWLWDNNQDGRGPGSGPWTVEQTRGWLASLDVRYHVISKDGSHKITMNEGSYRIERLDWKYWRG